MILTLLKNNIEIVVAVVSFSGMLIYFYLKGEKPVEENNDLTQIIIKHKKFKKDIDKEIEGKLFNFK